MKATLIEIDCGIAHRFWYARHPGLRLWARQVNGDVYGESTDPPLWRVMPGQANPVTGDSSNLLVDLEHAWQVREGDVELRLIEIPSAAGPAA
jgi:hypothetical protein